MELEERGICHEVPQIPAIVNQRFLDMNRKLELQGKENTEMLLILVHALEKKFECLDKTLSERMNSIERDVNLIRRNCTHLLQGSSHPFQISNAAYDSGPSDASATESESRGK